MSSTPPPPESTLPVSFAAIADLPDLAREDVGGAALATSDDFFAEKENLLRVHPAEWRDEAYTDRGKWMDGWESRRRRGPGEAGGPAGDAALVAAHDDAHDWCLIRLGMPGEIHGFVVDTAYFRGNYPAACSIEACEVDGALDLAALATASWTELLPKSALAGHKANAFPIAARQRFTHLRLNMFPDGGIARLRVHGQPTPRWDALRAQGRPIDLAALEHGAIVETCSDMFFGSRNNLIKPGPAKNMGDGWETKRRRGPGNDWAIVRLAAAGSIDHLEIDTSHFKGNAPGRCVVEGVHAAGAGPVTSGEQLTGWRTILASPLQPHTRHHFADELRRVGDLTHVRLSVFPDGGVARLRVWGALAPGPAAGVERLNAMPAADATAALLRCCGSTAWAAAMTARRPFEDAAALLRIGERELWRLREFDWLQAFAAHPKIGEQTVPTTGDAAWSTAEQRDAAGAAAATAAALAEANAAYQAKHGFIYIVCASGRSAEAMLADLVSRLGGSRAEELRTAGEEQAKITRLRLQKLIAEVTP